MMELYCDSVKSFSSTKWKDQQISPKATFMSKLSCIITENSKCVTFSAHRDMSEFEHYEEDVWIKGRLDGVSEHELSTKG